MEATGTYKREEVEKLILEGEKTKRKLQKLQQRRDHYARLYYQAIMELDMSRLALERARAEISDLRTQVSRQRKIGVGSNTASPDSGTTSLSPGIDALTRLPRADLHPVFGQPDSTEHTADEVVWTHTRDPHEKTLRAPTGCPAPPTCTLSQPWFRRSLSLSQHDPVLPPQTSISGPGPRFNSMSQDCTFLEPRKFERTLSVPHRVQRPIHLHASKLSSVDDTASGSGSGTAVSIRQSAFKQLSPPVQLQEHPQTSAKSIGLSNFVCERSEIKLSSLSQTELENVCSELTASSCRVMKLELTNCGLGQPANMKLFCDYIIKNKSIVELSLPHNGIAMDSLSLLLDTLQHCPSIKELLLRHNLIDHKCATKIKEFLEVAMIDALVLTGNVIEQHGHLLDGSLPSDFTMEYGRHRETESVESEDSGLPQNEPVGNEHNPARPFSAVQSAFKQLHI